MNTPGLTTPRATSTRNACRQCAPLGACLAYRGIEGAMPLIHGSQGCSTYIRRYVIGHFREPIDIAASNFTEETAIFGGETNLHTALTNVIEQYAPKLIGVATTCLSETIGDDVKAFLRRYQNQRSTKTLPLLVHASTPSYRGTHADGFQETVRELVKTCSERGDSTDTVTILPGMFSPADIRHIKQIARDFDMPATVLPDYSDTLDGGHWETYQVVPQGGTPLEALRQTANSRAVLEIHGGHDSADTAGSYLRDSSRVPLFRTGVPVGIEASDRFFGILSELAGKAVPDRYRDRRARLLDSYVDGHKMVAGKRAMIYGDSDLVAAVAAFFSEIGLDVAVCATGSAKGTLTGHNTPGLDPSRTLILEDADFETMADAAGESNIDIMVGHSKGYAIARRIGVPLVRIGFPIHDRFGGQRILHFGYAGTQALYDRIVNALIETTQQASGRGYMTY